MGIRKQRPGISTQRKRTRTYSIFNDESAKNKTDKILGSKDFRLEIIFGSKNFWLEIFLTRKIFVPKIFWIIKNKFQSSPAQKVSSRFCQAGCSRVSFCHFKISRLLSSREMSRNYKYTQNYFPNSQNSSQQRYAIQPSSAGFSGSSQISDDSQVCQFKLTTIWSFFPARVIFRFRKKYILVAFQPLCSSDPKSVSNLSSSPFFVWFLKLSDVLL